ncbi:MAG TPA: hypothetical protein ENK43_02125 [Planctomycetes bacterium]|nr:hypothetical protein [Planctomycetota bacterium]
MTLVIILILVGCTLVVAELMFPSFGMLGILAVTSFLVAILKAFAISPKSGYIAVGGVCVAVPLGIWIGLTLLQHTRLGNRLLMKGPPPDQNQAATTPDLAELVGARGHTVTPMRPAGIIQIGNRRVDAVSDGSFLESNRPVRVTHVEGNRVVVTGETPPTDDT